MPSAPFGSRIPLKIDLTPWRSKSRNRTLLNATSLSTQAILAGPIQGPNTSGVSRAVRETIARLRRTSNSSQSLGHRYARSLHLLWSRASDNQNARNGRRDEISAESARLSTNTKPQNSTTEQQSQFSDGGGGGQRGGNAADDLSQMNGFSWWDLDSLGQFIGTDDSPATLLDGALSGPEVDLDYGTGGLEGSSGGLWSADLWNGSDFWL